jgi:hypothetical protein
MTELTHNSPRPHLATVPPAEPKGQHEEYPQSTLCLKVKVGDVEMSWTLRGDDSDVARRLPRALATIKKLQEEGKIPQAPRTEPLDRGPGQAPDQRPGQAPAQPPLEEREDWCAFTRWRCRSRRTSAASGIATGCRRAAGVRASRSGLACKKICSSYPGRSRVWKTSYARSRMN